MKHNEMDQAPFEQQSLENLVHFYQDELHEINEGKSIFETLSHGVRKRLIDNEIIYKKFRVGYGCRYFITELGKEMLANEC